MIRNCIGLIAAFLGMAPLAVHAQEWLELDAGATWEHPYSHIVVPAKWGGLAREEGIAFAPDFLDVGIQFASANSDEMLSVYIFRQTSGAVPVWMAQAEAAITPRGNFGTAEIVGATTAFTPPGQSQPSGLEAIFQLDADAPFRSTGVAMFALDIWLVKVRASSARRSPAELEQWMQAAISELELPAANSPVAVPVTDCKSPLRFDDSVQDAPEDMGANLLGGLMNNLLMQQEQPTAENTLADPVHWCIDSVLGEVQSVYRADEQTDGYLLALSDNGVAVQVYRDTLSDLLAEPGDKPAARYAITMQDAEMSTQYAAQDGLPSPRRVVEVINDGRIVSRTRTWGDKRDIEITAPSED